MSTEPPSVGCHGPQPLNGLLPRSLVDGSEDRPRATSTVEVARNGELPLPDDEGEALRLQAGCRDDPHRHVPRIDRQPIAELDDPVRQVPAAAGADEHLDAELLAQRLRPAA